MGCCLSAQANDDLESSQNAVPIENSPHCKDISDAMVRMPARTPAAIPMPEQDPGQDPGQATAKGQLISKCPFGVFKSTKKQRNFL